MNHCVYNDRFISSISYNVITTKGRPQNCLIEKEVIPVTGTKYLSEVVKLDALQKDHLNIIKAPTGSGKTYFALTAIPATLTDAVHKVVYLIDTINGREQILQNYNARSI